MIKMSISNIAWLPENDEEMYSFMNHLEYSGLEIAPTRIFPEKPYNKIIEAKKFKKNLKEKYNLEISSMQSILYGINEKIFSLHFFCIHYAFLSITYVLWKGYNFMLTSS